MVGYSCKIKAQDWGKANDQQQVLVHLNRTKIVSPIGNFMSSMDKIYVYIGLVQRDVLQSTKGFTTPAIRSVVHMANIPIAWGTLKGVTRQYPQLYDRGEGGYHH